MLATTTERERDRDEAESLKDTVEERGLLGGGIDVGKVSDGLARHLTGDMGMAFDRWFYQPVLTCFVQQ